MTDRNTHAHLPVEEEQRADLRLWAERWRRGEYCPRCMWPFQHGHLCVEPDVEPTETAPEGDR